MSKNVGLILGLGLAAAVFSPLSVVHAQLAPGQGQLTPEEKKKAEEKKKQANPNQAQPQRPVPPGNAPSGQPRANPDVRRGPDPQRAPPPPRPTQVQPQPNPQVTPAPRKEFLPKSNTVPQLPPRPAQITPPSPSQPPAASVPPATSPTAPKAINSEAVPGPMPPATAPAVVPSAKPPQAVIAPTLTSPPATPLLAKPQPEATSKIPAAVLPLAPQSTGVSGGFRPGFQTNAAPVQGLSDIRKGRTQRVENGGKLTVIHETDNRVIIKEGNQTIIRHDDTQRFAKNATNIQSQQRPDGTTQTVVFRPGGVQLVNVVDNSGRLVRRFRRDERGREVTIIDNRRFYRNLGIGLGVGLAIGAVALALRPPEVLIAREKYIVDYDRASDDDIYDTLISEPIERMERGYSLEEIRFSPELRDRMRRIDLDTITFDTGSWDVGQEQFPKLERVARIMRRIIDQRPSEVFLVEGHTDAVGSDVDNLTLSDRRAQAVAEVLSSVFDVPPENLVTQGYGEQFLKVSTRESERTNRRVAIRRITPLMAEDR